LGASSAGADGREGIGADVEEVGADVEEVGAGVEEAGADVVSG